MNEQQKQPNLPPDDYERELETDLDDKTADKPKGLSLHTKVLIGLLVGVVGGVLASQIVSNPALEFIASTLR